MKLRKKIIAGLLILLAAVSIVSFIRIGSISSAFAAGDVEVSSESELKSAINASSDVSIVLTGDITLTSSIYVTTQKTITIKKKSSLQTNPTITMSATESGANLARHFRLSNQAQLTLEDISLSGNKASGGVYLDKAKLNLNGTSSIINCVASKSYGGAIYLTNSAEVNISGTASIENNTCSYSPSSMSKVYCGGGGIYADSSTINLYGGSISNNSAKNGGGVCLNNRSILEMKSGSISSNTAALNYGGGVIVAEASTFNMYSGSVTLNSANGSSTSGGGICVYGSSSSNTSGFYMKGGNVSENTATLRAGGLYLYGYAFGSLSNDATIGKENTAKTGGGVCLYGSNSSNSSSLNMSGNSSVEYNTAYSGGGIALYNVGTKVLNLSGNATVQYNTATGDTASSDAGAGGGIFVGGGVSVTNTINMDTSSAVKNNTARYSGGGLDLTGNGTVLNMNDDASIYGNQASHGGGAAVWGDAVINLKDKSSVSSNKSVKNEGVAYSGGGGVYLSNRAKMNMADYSLVAKNSAVENGGGIYISPDAATLDNKTSFTMTGGTIEENIANGSEKGGGGIFFGAESTDISSIEISGKSFIQNNSAPNGHGGGIYCTEPYWDRLVIGIQTVFTGNSASVAYIPPDDVFTKYPKIQFASISIADLVPKHPLNNYDINYTGDRYVPLPTTTPTTESTTATTGATTSATTESTTATTGATTSNQTQSTTSTQNQTQTAAKNSTASDTSLVADNNKVSNNKTGDKSFSLVWASIAVAAASAIAFIIYYYRIKDHHKKRN